MKHLKFVLLMSLILCVPLSACSFKKTTTTMTAKIVIDGMRALESEPDIWIAKQSVIPLVKILEVLKEGDPANRRFSELMSKVYGNLAFGFFEPRYMKASEKEKGVWKARIERYYTLGYNSGMTSMRRRFGMGIDRSVMEFELSIEKAIKKDAMVLFWTAFNLGNLVNMNRADVMAIANMPKATAMIDKVLKIDPDFGYGSAVAFKAAMLASRPAMLGGNPEEAKKLFEEAVSMHGGKYLMTKVLYAEWYAIPQGDSKLAKRLLEEVLAGDPMAIPDQALANTLAHERAKLLLKRL